MNDKQPYTAPQIVRVELNLEQAVLSTCSASATSVLSGGAATQGCFNPQPAALSGCKKFNTTGGNSGGRAS